jgi:(p)ppGpp synthase/HD superfamily hydrolase
MKKHLLAKAIEFATHHHSGQFDRAGFPYILHPLRVLETVQDIEPWGSRAYDECYTKVVAVLHDVVEDTDVTLDDIEREFDSTILEEVDALTKRKGHESYRAYLDRIRDRLGFGGLAIAVKLADMSDNSRPERLAHLPVEKQVRLAAKYARGRHYLLTGEWYENEDLDKVIKAGYKK